MSGIEYFYAAYSSYTWLGSARLMEISRASGCPIVHRPVDLNVMMAAAGSSSFGERSVKYRDYFFNREIERWAEFRGLRTLGRRPTYHHHGYDLANRALVTAILSDHNIDQLSHSFLDGHWAEDADLSDPATLIRLTDRVGLDGAALIDAASGPDVTARYEANTQEAIARGVFGSPTYFVDGDMFYGQDRLELVERALQQPFGRIWPRVTE
jgi:2-hydroxychromene-2-carboxylate isomerase